MNSSNFIYTGNVKIKIGNKKYNYRNSGKPYLFQILARCLCGLFPSTSELPNYLQFIGTDSDNLDHELLINPVKARTVYSGDDDNPQCIVKSTIEKTDFLAEILENPSYSSYKLKLLSSDRVDVEEFATIVVDNGGKLLESIGAGKQAYIEWSLSFGNETTAQPDEEAT